MGKASTSSNKSKLAREARKAEQYRLADYMKLVTAANALKSPELNTLCSELLNFEIGDKTVVLSCCHVADLPPQTLEWAIDLTTRNMKTLYETCAWGWNLRKKTEEMSEDEAWYAVARIGDQNVAFSHFRFDMDHGDPVVYCYELQVEERHRGRGVGGRLLALLERVAARAGMRCVRLTALRHNPRAAAFFRHSGRPDYHRKDIVKMRRVGSIEESNKVGFPSHVTGQNASVN